jgi:hypothetical protein
MYNSEKINKKYITIFSIIIFFIFLSINISITERPTLFNNFILPYIFGLNIKQNPYVRLNYN